ncbi:MAG: phosphatase PAP2 family protein [Bacteroides sp.]|nr:phosphatase PAP2 family protein [Bacteroides sp.]MDD2646106.1 phosphatase PAP2 family protein [Bacteroides sp.]MDD4055188.1 phosphatase PAP2 family protein [Bacteroides sp.]MDD4720402.1 phosphatase PAP2 family protein [Bacteroides sp.]NLI64079.1 phosphatase PAP2 family protein [Bacteroidales bacterium]
MNAQNNVQNPIITQLSRVISKVFTPYYIPFLAFFVLFKFTYLNLMPLQYKLSLLSLVFVFTLLVPTLSIYIFGKINNYTMVELNHRQKRFIPLILVSISYLFCVIMLYRIKTPWYLNSIMQASLLGLIIITLTNFKWRISEHMFGVGAIIAGIIAFNILFDYYTIWWLCLAIFVGGFVGSARITLGFHTLGEVLTGLLLGLICTFFMLNPTINILIMKYF